ncbi:MAG: four helix bundle protein [Deltaproteobacteria bacterium]|nr:four helix bundle protein [Deltaproteobacteria bacterium]
MKDFRELKVWQMAMELFMEVVRDVEAFPKTEVARIMANQVLRGPDFLRPCQISFRPVS